MAIDPPILLFDEPTANLDRAAVPLIEVLLRRLGDAGKTVVLSTHNLEQAYRLGDDVLALHDGRIAASPLVNLLHGHTVRSGGRPFFASGDLRIELADEREAGHDRHRCRRHHHLARAARVERAQLFSRPGGAHRAR